METHRLQQHGLIFKKENIINFIQMYQKENLYKYNVII